MEGLVLVAPRELPNSTPLRITIRLRSSLLHHFDPSIEKTPWMATFLQDKSHAVSSELARRALYTCFGQIDTIPPLKEGGACRVKGPYDRNTYEWDLLLQFDCSVPSDQKDPPLVHFQAKADLDNDNNVKFIALVPQNAKARERFTLFMPFRFDTK
jgi:hypothetical protein